MLLIALLIGVVAMLYGARGRAAVSPRGRAWGPYFIRPQELAGLDARLVELCFDWSHNGTHAVQVGSGEFGGISWYGAVRTPRIQDYLAMWGLSKATGDNGPHVRAGAVDWWPVGFVPNRSFAEQKFGFEDMAKSQADFARSRGFIVGYDWQSPDVFHVEVADWEQRPVGPENSTLELKEGV